MSASNGPGADATLTVEAAGGGRRQVSATLGESLSQALFLAGLAPEGPQCAGLGRCGRCRVEYLTTPPEPLAAEHRLLSPQELAQGRRLACLHPATADNAIRLLPPRTRPLRRQDLLAQAGEGCLRLAVDLGTTSLCWTLLAGETPLVRGQRPNPQLPAGSEVMSRLALAQAGHGAELQRVVVASLREILAEALAAVAAPGRMTEKTMQELVIAGNPAMMLLLLGLPVSGLARAPYGLDYLGGTVESLAADLPPCWVVPLLAPFVGGDLTAGVLALELGPAGPPEYPYLLADMGTNGEFVLALSPDHCLVASVPLGPALEGAGLRWGSLAGPGVMTGATLTPGGIVPMVWPGSRPPLEGISGTGYLSLLSLLKSVGTLDAHGRFGPGTTPLARRLAACVDEEAGQEVFRLPDGLFVEAADIEELLKVKAAFHLAVSQLLRHAGLAPTALRHVFLAGALGSHVVPADMIRLGFLPAACEDRVRAPGNTALAGAELLAARPEARELAARLRPRCHMLDLTMDPDFQRQFVERMRFVYDD